MKRLVNHSILGIGFAALTVLAPMVIQAQDHRNERSYHDRDHNDDHHWDSHEDRAYRMWAKENHRKYQNFQRLREDDQRAYWGWRHEHSDAILKINIR